MRQEDKEILIRDLCGRLSYGVKAYIKNWSNLSRKYYEGVYIVESIDPSLNSILANSERSSVDVIVGYDDYEIKPYLFPLSSMTEEQYDELYIDSRVKNDSIDVLDALANDMDAIDWLNKNHFDYRGLIEKGLAIDATGLDVY